MNRKMNTAKILENFKYINYCNETIYFMLVV